MKRKTNATQPIHHRRLIKVTGSTMKKDLPFWLPVILRAESEGRVKAGSTSLELSLLLV